MCVNTQGNPPWKIENDQETRKKESEKFGEISKEFEEESNGGGHEKINWESGVGKDGGEMANFCDVEIRAPKSKYADRAQEIHIKVIHSLIDSIERKIC